MAGPKAELPKLLQGLQKRLESDLGIAREVIAHPGTKGDASELHWIKMLRDHLPARYCVSRAFIIDSNNACSDQIDVVIHDHQYSPFVFTDGAATFVPAESVYGVFEVKQAISKEQIKYAADKILSDWVTTKVSRVAWGCRIAGGPTGDAHACCQPTA